MLRKLVIFSPPLQLQNHKKDLKKWSVIKMLNCSGVATLCLCYTNEIGKWSNIFLFQTSFERFKMREKLSVIDDV